MENIEFLKNPVTILTLQQLLRQGLTTEQILKQYNENVVYEDEIVSDATLKKYFSYFKTSGVLVLEAKKNRNEQNLWRINKIVEGPLRDLLNSAESLDGSIRRNTGVWKETNKFDAISELVLARHGMQVVKQIVLEDKHTVAEFDNGYESPYAAAACRHLYMLGFIEREKNKTEKCYSYYVQPKLKDCYVDFFEVAERFCSSLDLLKGKRKSDRTRYMV